MARFDEDIALTATGNGGYSLTISDSWNVVIGPNGGYIAALMLRGLKQELKNGPQQTRSITYHFLSASVPGPATLVVETKKIGRTLATATATLSQGERTIAVALATFADRRDFFEFCDLAAPRVTPAADIPTRQQMGPGMVGHVPFRDHYDQRLAIGPTPPNTGSEGRVGGWTRFTDQRDYDDEAIVAISDSWYPSISARDTPSRLHVPTVDHTVHFVTSLPVENLTPEDFLLVEFETRVAHDGYLVEDGNIWSPDGMLIARSRQLAIMMPRDNH